MSWDVWWLPNGTFGEVEDPSGDNNEIIRIYHSCCSKKADTTRNRSRVGKRKAKSASNLQAAGRLTQRAFDAEGISCGDRSPVEDLGKACAKRV